MPKKRFAIKTEDDDDIKENDVSVARGRLAGALQGIIEGSDDSKESDSTDDEEYRPNAVQPSKSNTGHNFKGKKKRLGATECQQTYIMKLFDRSVDLAQFNENTPLYPVCRAWMTNEPKLLKPKMRLKQEKEKDQSSLEEPPIRKEMSEIEFDENNIKDIYTLPAPTGPSGSRLPPPLDFHLNRNKNNINLNYETSPPVNKELLLEAHRKRWTKVKAHWLKHAFENEKRYEPSTIMLTAIYNKAQENMDY